VEIKMEFFTFFEYWKIQNIRLEEARYSSNESFDKSLNSLIHEAMKKLSKANPPLKVRWNQIGQWTQRLKKKFQVSIEMQWRAN
jgi:hypothetical protein